MTISINVTMTNTTLISKTNEKTPADNERFHASGGVFPQTILWEFGSLSPARAFVKPPPA
jgi:hypothetical protein